ncbi:hypothetical protein [Hymenobacter negativus]|uniref:Glycosyltransferase RgtA/B/C/D-like domain-containing protein n=1 Tax=Hymenobacter negativus TaxID=2795026 RepID=A0ABS3QKC1_9BACT|nr:hypothetical protein [Hymenobacter negativus]MBO2011697.1 hypothetical protein [Hymenobacter negativus]
MAFADSPVSAAPARRYQLLFAGILVMAGLLQLALYGYATMPGLAGTSDSRLYLHAAQTLRDTGQLLNPDGTPYRYWPPLYPVLLRYCGSLAGIRVLHGSCLLGSLMLWSWLGRQLLPTGRALVLPVLLALSTPWLLVSKFVWSESLFILLFATYSVALFQWLRTGRWMWWLAATITGFLMPLERTLGLFLLAGAGVGLVLGEWRHWLPNRRWLGLGLHLLLSTAGGVWWQWYALHAGPSRYHPSRGWSQLLSSGADYGFVLGRWLLLLPASGRALLPDGLWAAVLLALFWWLWPRPSAVPQREASPVGFTAVVTSASRPLLIFSRTIVLRMLWGACAMLVLLVAALTVFAQSAAGIHDAERYASVLAGPILLLVLAAWPAQLPRWLNMVAVATMLVFAVVRVGHVARDLRRVPPLALTSFLGPEPDGQHVGAASE